MSIYMNVATQAEFHFSTDNVPSSYWIDSGEVDVEGNPIMVNPLTKMDEPKPSGDYEGNLEGHWSPRVIPDEEKAETERLWRDSELSDFVDKYQGSLFRFSLLESYDRVAIYSYYDDLLDYPQSVGFPNGVRPERPCLCDDEEATEEVRWETRIQREIERRRLTPIIFHNVQSGVSGSELPVTISIAPTVESVANMTSYVAETVVNGMVEVWWDTEGNGSVQLSVQNLKPIFKAGEMYLSHLYEAKKNLVAAFDNRNNIDLRTSGVWPSMEITLV